MRHRRTIRSVRVGPRQTLRPDSAEQGDRLHPVVRDLDLSPDLLVEAVDPGQDATVWRDVVVLVDVVLDVDAVERLRTASTPLPSLVRHVGIRFPCGELATLSGSIVLSTGTEKTPAFVPKEDARGIVRPERGVTRPGAAPDVKACRR